jgi:hypothetical protein
MCRVSRRTSGGTLAAFLIFAAIVGFAGGAYLGTQSSAEEPNSSPTQSADADGEGDAGADGNNDEPNDDETPNADEEQPSDATVTLAFDQSSVSPGTEVSYSGRINSGEAGVTLQLQRSVDGGPWEDFNVSARTTDADGAFGGTVRSSREGENRFRMVGIDDESIVSETAILTIG